jgi:hypothetical protein
MQTFRKGTFGCRARPARWASGAAVAAGASLALVVLASSAGCVVEAGVAASAGAGIAVAGPPPEPMVDARPPGDGVWVAGYWHWTGMRYTWIPGHWERPPAGAVWHPPRYFTRDGVYYYEHGGWTRR